MMEQPETQPPFQPTLGPGPADTFDLGDAQQPSTSFTSSSPMSSDVPTEAAGNPLFTPLESQYMAESMRNMDVFDPFSASAAAEAAAAAGGSASSGQTFQGPPAMYPPTSGPNPFGMSTKDGSLNVDELPLYPPAASTSLPLRSFAQPGMPREGYSEQHVAASSRLSLLTAFAPNSDVAMRIDREVREEQERYKWDRRGQAGGRNSFSGFVHGGGAHILEGGLGYGVPHPRAQSFSSGSGPGSSSFTSSLSSAINAPDTRERPSSASSSSRSGSLNGRLGDSLIALGLSFPSSHTFPAAPRAQGMVVESPSAPSATTTATFSTSLPHTYRGSSRTSWALPTNPSPEGSDGLSATRVESSQRPSGKRRRGSKLTSGSGDVTMEEAVTTPSSAPKEDAQSQGRSLTLGERSETGVASAPDATTSSRGRAASTAATAATKVTVSTLNANAAHNSLSRSPGRPASSEATDATSTPTSNATKGSKQPHVLLTEAEKRANHIASEQKRRANIRRGYEGLCDIVPPLREALEREAEKERMRALEEVEEEQGGGEDEGSGAGEEGAKKRKRGKRRKEDAGCEIGGEKIDGRAGPRSEFIVLTKSVEYLREQLHYHKALLRQIEEVKALQGGGGSINGIVLTS